jgi:hypothetical protein
MIRPSNQRILWNFSVDLPQKLTKLGLEKEISWQKHQG